MNCIVIDDDEAVGVYMRKLIADTGFLNLLEYFSRPDVAAGYILANVDNIDVVFVDVEMPGMSGIDLISTLGDAAGKIKFVVISPGRIVYIDGSHSASPASWEPSFIARTLRRFVTSACCRVLSWCGWYSIIIPPR